jgi:hypothetical protein
MAGVERGRGEYGEDGCRSRAGTAVDRGLGKPGSQHSSCCDEDEKDKEKD